jgi:hypothetical protein
MPGIGNYFEASENAINNRKKSERGYLPGDVAGLVKFNILQSDGKTYDPILQTVIQKENVQDLINWIIVGNFKSAYPPIINFILCQKYKRIKNAVPSTGTSEAQRTLENKQLEKLRLLLKQQNYVVNLNDKDAKCEVISKNFNSEAVAKAALEIAKKNTTPTQTTSGSQCIQHCEPKVYITTQGPVGVRTNGFEVQTKRIRTPTSEDPTEVKPPQVSPAQTTPSTGPNVKPLEKAVNGLKNSLQSA